MLTIMRELGATLFAGIMGAVVIMTLLRPRKKKAVLANLDPEGPQESGTVFLFQDGDLVDATPDAWALIDHCTKNLSDYDAMLNAIEGEFPRLKTTLSDSTVSDLRIRSESDASVFIDIQRTENRLRIALNGEENAAYDNATKRLSKATRDAQTSLMHDITTHSPQLIWHEDDAGNLLWANDAYASALKASRKDALFEVPDADAPLKRCLSVAESDDTKEKWFDVTTVKRDGGFLHFGNDATAVKRADTARSEFVKTLGKTFAEISIGLAIFDKDRQLVMFNPALLDMTKLPIDFLSSRPTIDTVLDRLRELRMMPEPKNYTSWREQFTAVEMAAKQGTYSKNWALPDGQTYRVTGRPHPDGAFAFLFEDISAEVSLTRRFRQDIETGQAVLDTLSDAIAVFSTTGTLVMSNHAYATLWSSNPELMLEHRVLQSEITIWQERCIPSPMWAEMRSFIQQIGTRAAWSDDALMDDGRNLRCRAEPIAGGMTIVRFAIAEPRRPTIRKLTLPDTMIQMSKR